MWTFKTNHDVFLLQYLIGTKIIISIYKRKKKERYLAIVSKVEEVGFLWLNDLDLDCLKFKCLIVAIEMGWEISFFN